MFARFGGAEIFCHTAPQIPFDEGPRACLVSTASSAPEDGLSKGRLYSYPLASWSVLLGGPSAAGTIKMKDWVNLLYSTGRQ